MTHKIVVYVPIDHADKVRETIGEAGGGKIGSYSFCSFSMRGVGRFRPEQGAQPHIGKVGENVATFWGVSDIAAEYERFIKLGAHGIIKGDNRSGKEGRSAIEYILPCLDSHDPLDYVIVCLGTNELKAECALSVEQVGENLKQLVTHILAKPSQFRNEKPKVMIMFSSLNSRPSD